MFRSTPWPQVTLLITAALLSSHVVRGQVPRSGGGPSAQLVEELQQLAADRASLQAQNEKLQKDLDAMRKERDSLKSAQQALERRAGAAEAQLRTAQETAVTSHQSEEKELTDAREKMQQLIAKFRETINVLQTTETEAATAKTTLAVREQALKVCVDRNIGLYKLNQEVLDRLEHDSLWSHLTRAEPFTRIKRIQLENLIDGYAQQARDLRAPGSNSTTGSSGAARAAAKPAN